MEMERHVYVRLTGNECAVCKFRANHKIHIQPVERIAKLEEINAELLAALKGVLPIVEEDLQYANHAGQRYSYLRQLDMAREVIRKLES